MSEAPSAACQTLANRSQGTLEWEKDGRFGCMVAAFPIEQAAEVRALMLGAAAHEWSADTIEAAPEPVRQLAARMGLRAGQLLFTSDPGGAQMLYGAWWPWGGGQRVSVRVGLSGASPDELAPWFGVD